MTAHNLPKTTAHAGWGPLLVHTEASVQRDDVLPASPRAPRCQTTERNRMSRTRLIGKAHAHATKVGTDRPVSWSKGAATCITRAGSAFSRARSISRTASFARVPSVTKDVACILRTPSSSSERWSLIISRTASAAMASEFEGLGL